MKRRSRLARKVPLRSRKGLRRTGGPGRKTRLNPVNQKRKAREFQRAFGGSGRAAWVQRQPCIVCGTTPCDNAHVETGGKGRKADADKVVPLCRFHHDEHHRGAETFERTYHIDLHAEAARIDALWRSAV